MEKAAGSIPTATLRLLIPRNYYEVRQLVVDAEGHVKPVPLEPGMTWRVPTMSWGIRSKEGRLNPVTALSAAAPWCLDSSSWLEILLRGWQGVLHAQSRVHPPSSEVEPAVDFARFIALSLLAEQVCHSSAGGCEHAWETWPHEWLPGPEDFGYLAGAITLHSLESCVTSSNDLGLSCKDFRAGTGS